MCFFFYFSSITEGKTLRVPFDKEKLELKKSADLTKYKRKQVIYNNLREILMIYSKGRMCSVF